MRFLQKSFLLAALMASTVSFAQTAPLLSSVPQTREEFVKTEKSALSTIDWMEKTPINKDAVKFKEQEGLLMNWISGSPNVSIMLNEKLVPYVSNPQLLFLFMAGWTKYSLEHNYSKDEVQGNLAGTRFVINKYKAEKMPKNEDVDKLAMLDQKGELEKWVKDQLAASKQ
ncbi:hypothetical protein [Taibaiella soli]|uniref:Uncharacterized protein n=1 Tax=Taibaiella soli TaxID=1649169 RepID=A0A2W2AE94_9BACT|nr:hypothetical protein [Taibaiella soli]PZF73611.1 hypothetical protein DN068_07770 [Taibaiella soli]